MKGVGKVHVGSVGLEKHRKSCEIFALLMSHHTQRKKKKKKKPSTKRNQNSITNFVAITRFPLLVLFTNDAEQQDFFNINSNKEHIKNEPKMMGYGGVFVYLLFCLIFINTTAFSPTNNILRVQTSILRQPLRSTVISPPKVDRTGTKKGTQKKTGEPDFLFKGRRNNTTHSFVYLSFYSTPSNPSSLC